MYFTLQIIFLKMQCFFCFMRFHKLFFTFKSTEAQSCLGVYHIFLKNLICLGLNCMTLLLAVLFIILKKKV